MNDIKYPHIKVKLTGTDGNVFALTGRMKEALRKGGVDSAEIKAFTEEVFQSESYDAVLRLFMRTVKVS